MLLEEDMRLNELDMAKKEETDGGSIHIDEVICLLRVAWRKHQVGRG